MFRPRRLRPCASVPTSTFNGGGALSRHMLWLWPAGVRLSGTTRTTSFRRQYTSVRQSDVVCIDCRAPCVDLTALPRNATSACGAFHGRRRGAPPWLCARSTQGMAYAVAPAYRIGKRDMQEEENRSCAHAMLGFSFRALTQSASVLPTHASTLLRLAEGPDAANARFQLAWSRTSWHLSVLCQLLHADFDISRRVVAVHAAPQASRSLRI